MRALRGLGFSPVRLELLTPDASHRRFFRVFMEGDATLVASLYPPEAEAQAERDFAVQRWGSERGLPIPKPLGRSRGVVVSEDLGEEDLERALPGREEEVLAGTLTALEAFQGCSWRELGTLPFNAAFFRRELAVFEEFAAGGPLGGAGGGFLDGLARRLANHPYRLVHRDFHVNNLFWHCRCVVAVDFQDMRGGPDTYDAASLLRERAGARLIVEPERWLAIAARRLAWPAGWQERFVECAAQRGLKIIGTFLRLIANGKRSYGTFLPDVRHLALEALRVLAAPSELLEVAAARFP